MYQFMGLPPFYEMDVGGYWLAAAAYWMHDLIQTSQGLPVKEFASRIYL